MLTSVFNRSVWKKAKNTHLKHNSQYKNMRTSPWICANLRENCEENCECRTSVFNSHVCKKSEIMELKQDFQCKKQAFLSDSAWICAILWENSEEIRRCRLQYSTYMCVCKKAKNTHLKHNLQNKNTCFWAFLLEFVPICEKIVKKIAFIELQYSTYMFAKKKTKIAELKQDFQSKK